MNIDLITSLFLKMLPHIGISGVVFIIAVLLVLNNPEKYQKWSVYFWKIILFVYRGAEKKIIANDIESRVNGFTKSIMKEFFDFRPYGVKIQWVKNGETADQFFADNSNKSDNYEVRFY
jgi:hypothetical protein